MGDLLQNLGVILAGAVIWWRPTWQVADPLVTLFFALIVVRTTMGFMGKAVNILLEGAPANVDIGGLKKGLEDVEGVGDVHDIHVWELTADRPAMSCHVVLAPGRRTTRCSRRQDVCADDFDIDHATIQVQASHCRDGCAFVAARPTWAGVRAGSLPAAPALRPSSPDMGRASARSVAVVMLSACSGGQTPTSVRALCYFPEFVPASETDFVAALLEAGADGDANRNLFSLRVSETMTSMLYY